MGSLLEGPKIKKTKPITVPQIATPQITSPGLDRAISGGTTAAAGLSPVMFSGGGLSSRLSGNTLSIGSSSGRTGLVNQLATLFNAQAGETRSLRDKVAPGVSELREARLAEIENARSSSISNLRDNLARRRVLGSSFGEDAQTRAELEFGQERDRVAAETFLQELDLTNQLINQEYEQRSAGFTTKLNELNLQADVAGKLLPQVTQTMQASAELRSQIATIEAQIRAQMGIAQGQIAGQTNIAQGEIAGNLRSVDAQLDSKRKIAQSELDAKAQEGFGKLIGTGLSIALAPATGGLSLSALGAGGLMAPKKSVFPV